jgi:pectinesterase
MVSKMLTNVLLAAFSFSIFATASPTLSAKTQSQFTIFPASGANDVNPDTHLVLTLSGTPKIGTSGFIRIYNAADKSLVDTIDMKIPSSPYPSGKNPKNVNGETKGPDSSAALGGTFQVTTVAGHSFHFFPIIVHNNIATIYLHNNKLQYGQTYIVKIDPGVLEQAGGSFPGITSDNGWTFTTKSAPPPKDTARVVVAADGSGDFSTLQGAIDFLPEAPAKQITIFVKNGNYEEIVVMNKKSNVVIRGEDREKVRVGYPNNSFFNIGKTRNAFTIERSTNLQLSSFTVINYFIGQAEAIRVGGKRIILDHMTLDGSGDAFTTDPGTSIYFVDSKLTGHGDTILGYGAVFFHRSEVHSIGPFSWTRTSHGNHGNIFVNSSLIAIKNPLPWSVTERNPKGQTPESTFARLTKNCKGEDMSEMDEATIEKKRCNFPYAEMVLINTKTSGISPRGWGDIQPEEEFSHKNIHFWEYNTMNADGSPVDYSQRSRDIGERLKMPENATIIADYSNPEFILGWNPVVV